MWYYVDRVERRSWVYMSRNENPMPKPNPPKYSNDSMYCNNFNLLIIKMKINVHRRSMYANAGI